MKLLILFAMIALVIFLVMIGLRQDVLVSIVVSVLAGLILAYYLNHLTISYTPPKDKSKSVPAPAPSASSVPANIPNTTTIQSSASNAALNANTSNFDFFKSINN